LAVDLTLIELESGKEIDMGTGFDNFTDTAHHSFQQLSAPVLNNRDRLKRLMEEFGFRPVETEWWHYNWPDDHSYELLDLSFKDLLRFHRKNN
jgi:D-alanyl-D-alanine dipeptidase